MGQPGSGRPIIVVAAIGWMAVIFGLSSMRGSAVPGHFGTQAHFLEYAVLGTLYLFALPRSSRWWIAAGLAVLLASAYGATDEFHQSFVPGRVPDVVDWLVDTGGALSAVALVEALRGRAKRRMTRQADAAG